MLLKDLYLTLIGAALLAFNTYAQESSTYGNAILDAPACITLSDDEPLKVHYEMSISELGFTTEEELDVWKGHYSNNLITLSGDFSAGKAYIQLHNERMSEAKDLAWWNAYLSDLCTYYLKN
ncbi:MAG: hypothetical protein MK078_04230 [Crocinitomicaceae bacterium]|nr:hypothetical protein [Crocinitomicaceae bacterium]